MMNRFLHALCTGFAVFFTAAALAQQSPQEERDELMGRVGEAADPIGEMLKGEQAFDALIAMDSLRTFAEVAPVFMTLFPEGSETGFDTEARSTIWTDRAGFESAMAAFTDAVDAAIAAAPQDLDALNDAAGPVFNQCKACHEDYRVKKD